MSRARPRNSWEISQGDLQKAWNRTWDLEKQLWGLEHSALPEAQELLCAIERAMNACERLKEAM